MEMFLYFTVSCFVAVVAKQDNMNVLLILTDDLRPEISVYGRRTITPNFERLAARGIVFDFAYSQAPVCHPSRHSFLTGSRPDALNIVTFGDLTNVPWYDNIFTVLSRHNYRGLGIGKLFHNAKFDDKSMFPDDRWDGNWYTYQNNEEGVLNSTTTPDSERPESWFRDYLIATKAIDGLNEFYNNYSRPESVVSNPWLLSVGFKQPHTWYHLPQKYFNLYRDSPIFRELDDEDNVYPKTTPTIGYRCCATMDMTLMENEGKVKSNKIEHLRDVMKISRQGRKELLWGYLGGVSFMDSQMGRLFDELDRLDLWKTTIVIMTSDHGMHVGEKVFSPLFLIVLGLLTVIYRCVLYY